MFEHAEGLRLWSSQSQLGSQLLRPFGSFGAPEGPVWKQMALERHVGRARVGMSG